MEPIWVSPLKDETSPVTRMRSPSLRSGAPLWKVLIPAVASWKK